MRYLNIFINCIVLQYIILEVYYIDKLNSLVNSDSVGFCHSQDHILILFKSGHIIAILLVEGFCFNSNIIQFLTKISSRYVYD